MLWDLSSLGSIGRLGKRMDGCGPWSLRQVRENTIQQWWASNKAALDRHTAPFVWSLLRSFTNVISSILVITSGEDISALHALLWWWQHIGQVSTEGWVIREHLGPRAGAGWCARRHHFTLHYFMHTLHQQQLSSNELPFSSAVIILLSWGSIPKMT